MATTNAQRDAIEAGGSPPETRPLAGNQRGVPTGLYVLSLLVAGVAILAALLVVIAAGSGLSNVAVMASWVFIVASGLWAGGAIYILWVSGKRLWERLHSTSNGQPAN